MELLKVFDEQKNEIGVTSRDEAHIKGLWHEVFQCWLVSREHDKDYIYLQLRSKEKKDYSALFDITAAGHLLFDETVEDGVRELHEELGIEVQFKDLLSLGVIPSCMEKANFIDNEFANVFLYMRNGSFEQFNLQLEEVGGIVKVPFADFQALWQDKLLSIEVTGFEVGLAGEQITITKIIGKKDLVPHPASYYITVIERIEQYLK
ncbi:NUDIX hydrolase [Lysinibacillus sp. LZ02]|uniref:NUDIX hydrolase n=1 Tax=Lysinibacillus sp. LZ02 TaxID=3420668 RepID=UPI003D363D20